ncbi:hypothetical protein [Rhizobium leguminosarum]|uniref:hypothetical protein n=1 Tax=Rhizobium leguminosarum TaxID=384 RepID=UPI001039872D|nr:hypothetical protein [Rhizobium leguminosarum]TCA02762.1 hypothetical protein E0H63_17910 [Rhizobium leguminosarum bv. viciae]
MADTIDVKDATGNTVIVATNDAIVESVDAVKTSVDVVKTSIDTLDGSVDAVKASVDTVAGKIDTLDGSVDAVGAAVVAVGAVVAAGSVAQLGTRTVAQSPAVNIATDQPAIPVDQKTTAHDIALPITRPANITAYSANDVVGQTATAVLTFATIGKSGGSILITRAELELDISAIPTGMTSFRLYLYSSAPPSALADNAAFTWAGTDRAPFLGYIDLGAPVLIGGGTLYCDVTGINKQMKLATADIYAYLVTAGGYTPAANSEGYKLTLHSVEV